MTDLAGSLVTVTSPPIMRASVPGDGKAEPGTAKVLSGRSVSLAELLEQLCLLFRGQADAGVGDGELDEATAIAHLACRKLDFTLFGELALSKLWFRKLLKFLAWRLISKVQAIESPYQM